MKLSMRLPNLLFSLIVSVCVVVTSTHGQIGETRRVVVLSELGISAPAVAAVVRDLDVALKADSTYRIELYTEYLETALFPDEQSQADIRAWFIRKYQLRKPDVIIAVGPTPTKFMVDAHERFFSGIPIVFCCSSEQQADYPKLDVHFTGTWLDFDTDKTLEAAILLLPRTKNVVVVGGVGDFERHIEDLVKKTEREYPALQFTYLTNLPMETVFEQAKHLPDNTIILFTSVSVDSAGRRYNPNPELVHTLAVGANAPVFTLSDTLVGQGAVGGYVVGYLNQGGAAAAIALKLLHGAKPQEIEISKSTGTYMFDWRALRRWGINEGSLPSGSVVLNRQPGFWELYRRYVIVAIFLLAAQALVIGGLLWQRAARRKVQARLVTETEVLQAREELLKIFVKRVPAGVAMLDRDMRYLQVSDRWCADFALDSAQVMGRSHYELFPDIPDRWKEMHRRGLAGETVGADEDRWDRDGGTTWVRWEIRPWWVRLDDLPGGILIFSEDITHRKQMEEALSTVSQKLIEAHEEERTRIARELHDDVNQRLALLGVNLETLKQGLPSSASELRQEIDDASKQVEDLGSDVQALSHRLHSSKLEYLGLASAAAGFCRELSSRQGAQIDFHSEIIPKDLPNEISLCLFRVLQEALQNAIKHSGSRRFQVRFSNGSGEIELTVRDSGIGFDPEEAVMGRGLGLTSIRERLKLVGGNLSIDSQPQRGTTILARVPLSPRTKSAGAAG